MYEEHNYVEECVIVVLVNKRKIDTSLKNKSIYCYKTLSIMDQFYTKPEVATQCMNDLANIIDIDDFDIILEPSGGTGSFYNILPTNKREGLDIDPKCNGIKKMNFFDYQPVAEKKYCVIGNPPFGRVSSLAIKFFNHASNFAEVIAFIIPKTFKRVSVQNRLNRYFHLVLSKDLPLKPCCFSPKMGAKCCFQVWVKKGEMREIVELPLTHSDFEFLALGPQDDKRQPTCPFGADFVVKAYGTNCGEIKRTNLQTLRPKSWHWVKSNIDVDVLIARIKSLDFSVSKDTVRQDSIGRAELIQLYSEQSFE